MSGLNGHFDGGMHAAVHGGSVLDDPRRFADGMPPADSEHFRVFVQNMVGLQREFLNRLLDPRRDVDNDCGFPKALDAEQYWDLYCRDAIAARVCEVMPRAVWQVQPTVYETEESEDQTEFEAAWDDLCAGLRGERSFYQDEEGSPLWAALQRADILSGIGQYGILLLLLDDGRELSEPVEGVEERYSMPREVSRPEDDEEAGGPVDPEGTGDETDEDGEPVPTARFRPGKARPPLENSRRARAEMERLLVNRTEAGRPTGRYSLTWNYAPPNTRTGRGPGKEHEFDRDPAERGREPRPDEDPFPGATPKGAGAVDEDGEDGAWGAAILSDGDGEGTSAPRRRLLGLRPFPEVMASIVSYETNRTSPRYCQPTMYQVTFNDWREDLGREGSRSAAPTLQRHVHWTRVVHVPSDLRLSSEVFGMERMRQVYRNLLSLQKLYYGSAEMYWKGAFPGMAWSTHPQLGGQVNVDAAAMRGQMERFWNGLDRYVLGKGMTPQMLAPTVVDPTPQIDKQTEAICVRMDIPIPVFKGYEIGEQASTNNSERWDDKVAGARRTDANPRLVIPLVDRLINVGCLPEPSGYSIDWPKVTTTSATSRAGVILTLTQAMVAYVSGDAASFMPPMEYLTRVWSLTEEEAAGVIEAAEEVKAEQQREAEEELLRQMDAQEEAVDRGIVADPNDPELVPETAQGPGGFPPKGPPGAPPTDKENPFATNERTDNCGGPGSGKPGPCPVEGLEHDHDEDWEDGVKVQFYKTPFHIIDKTVEYPNGSQIRAAKLKTVKLSNLRATQKVVSKTGLDKPDDNSQGLPLVVKSNGVEYIQDGHHRLTKQHLAGKTTSKVRYVDLDSKGGA